MRKKHQSILVTTQAKRTIYNHLFLDNFSNEKEQILKLSKYFRENLNADDFCNNNKNINNDSNDNNNLGNIADINLDNLSNTSNSSFEVTDYPVPSQKPSKKVNVQFKVNENANIIFDESKDYTMFEFTNAEPSSSHSNFFNKDKSFIINKLKNVMHKVEKNDFGFGKNKKVPDKVSICGQKLGMGEIIQTCSFYDNYYNNDRSYRKRSQSNSQKELNIFEILGVSNIMNNIENKLDNLKNKSEIGSTHDIKNRRQKRYSSENKITTFIKSQQSKLYGIKQDIKSLSGNLDSIDYIEFGEEGNTLKFK